MNDVSKGSLGMNDVSKGTMLQKHTKAPKVCFY